MLRSYIKIIKNRNVTVTAVTLFLTFGTFLSWYLILPIYLRNIGATDINIGASYTFFNLCVCIMQFFGGFMADKFGRKKIITLPTFLLPLLYGGVAFTNNWKVAVVLIGISEMISGFQVPALYAITAESVKEEDRGLSFGIFWIALAASFTAGPALGVFYSDSIEGIRFMMKFSAVIALLCAVLRQIYLKETTEHEEFKVNFKEVIKSFNPNLILLLVSVTFMTFLFDITIYGPFLQLYAKDIIKINPDGIQKMFMMGGLFAIFFNLISGKVTQKMGPRISSMVGSLGYGVLLIPWLYSKNAWQAVALYIPAYLFLQLGSIGQDTVKSNLTDARTRSSIIGIFHMIAGLAASLAPVICTYISTFWGPKSPFILNLILAILAAAFMIPIKSEKI